MYCEECSKYCICLGIVLLHVYTCVHVMVQHNVRIHYECCVMFIIQSILYIHVVLSSVYNYTYMLHTRCIVKCV